MLTRQLRPLGLPIMVATLLTLASSPGPASCRGNAPGHPLGPGPRVREADPAPASRLADSAPPARKADIAPASSQKPTRQQLWSRLSREIKAGNRAAARQTAASYLRIFPGDALMTYNLACLEAQLGDLDAGWQNLQAAYDLGFTDLHRFESDPDLTPLRDQKNFASWLVDRRADLVRRSQARRLSLRDGSWSTDVPLEGEQAPVKPVSGLQGSTRVSFDGQGLQLMVHLRDPDLMQQGLPWQSDQGLVVTVVAPTEPVDFESQRYFSFGFGLENLAPAGAVIARHGAPIRQRIVELAPKVHLDPSDTEVEYTITIPWNSIAPYGPPLDTLLGLNVAYASRAATGALRALSLVPDPAVRSPTTPWRRYAPMALAPSGQSRAALGGRVSSTLVGDQPLEIKLVAWSPQSGPGRLRVEVQDVTGRSVVTSGPDTATVLLQPGRNEWKRAADVSALPIGPFRLVAKITLPAGGRLSWQTPLLRYQAGWLDLARQRLQQHVKPMEQATIQYRLDAIAAAIASHHPQDDPSPISTTLAETGQMLMRAERLGTVLPDSGLVIAAYPGPDGRPRPCVLRLPFHPRAKRPAPAAEHGPEPASGPPPAPTPLLVVLAGRGDPVLGLASLIGRDLAGDSEPAVLIPLAGGSTGTEDGPRPLAETPSAEQAARPPEPLTDEETIQDWTAAISWGRDILGATPVLLAGWQAGAAQAMRLSLRQPRLFAKILILANGPLAPWPDLDSAELVQMLAANRNQLGYSIVAADEIPEQTSTLAAALTEAGFQLSGPPRAQSLASLKDVAQAIATWARPADRTGR